MTRSAKKHLCITIAHVISTLAIATVGAAAAIAQEQAKGLEEVIVTARKTEENIQSIPVAITSLSADDMQNKGIFNVREISQSTPSLNITMATGNPASPRISLRGQVQNDAVFTLDPSVGIYLDEIYVGRAPGAMMDLYDIERVEILKGPQGTLYGRNTTGGAMKIITNKADTGIGWTGFLKGGLGNYNAKRVEAAVNVPLIEDKLAARVAGMINKRDGYSTNTIVDPVSGTPLRDIHTDDRDTQATRVDVLLNATEQLDIELQADYSDIDTNGSMAYNKFGDVPVAAQSSLTAGPSFLPMVLYNNYVRSSNDPLKATTNVVPYSNNITWGASLTATYTLSNDWIAKAVYGHRKVDGAYAFDVDGTSLGIVNTALTQGAKQDSVELQLSGNSFDSVDWVGGLYWFRETGYETSGQTLFNMGTSPQGLRYAPYFAEGENKSRSAYGQATWHFTDTISFTGGLRWTGDSKSLVSHNYTRNAVAGGFQEFGACNFTPGAPGITIVNAGGQAVVCESDQSKDYKHTSWTIGVDWQVLDDVLLYVKRSNGYRAGGQNLRGKSAVEMVPFDEEQVTDWEVGVKSTLWDNRLRANAAVYNSSYDGIQNTVFVPAVAGNPSGSQVVNLSDADVNGAELELTAQVLDELVLNATASYVDLAYTTTLTGNAAASYPRGLQVAFTPRVKYSLGATYTQPLTVGDLTVDVNYAWRDGFWSNTSKANNVSTPEARTDSVGLVNARIALQLQQFDASIGLWGTNLEDKHYSQNAIIFSAGGPNFVSTNPNEPRMFGVDITKKF